MREAQYREFVRWLGATHAGGKRTNEKGPPSRSSAAKLLTRDEARRIAANIAKLRELITSSFIRLLAPGAYPCDSRLHMAEARLGVICILIQGRQ
jgi:hypothetical protein